MPNKKSKHIIESCETVPANNIYGISASLPTFEDVFNYEINQNDWRKGMKSGYPRFFVHSFETKYVFWETGSHRILKLKKPRFLGGQNEVIVS